MTTGHTIESPPSGGGHPPTNLPVRPMPAVLDVVAVVSNPVRYRSRYSLYRAFERHMAESGVRLTTVECAYGDRPFEVTRPDHPRHVRLRTGSELWHKENLINLGIQRLPEGWEYVAWIDADVTFARPDWVQETLHQLQHHPVVQLWSHAQDLGPAHEPLQRHESFAFCHRRGDAPVPWAGYYHGGARPSAVPGCLPAGRQHSQALGRPNTWHPGFAWAATRQAIDDLGGLIDWAILGAGDHHMAKALLGRVREATAPGIGRRYLELLDIWQARAERYVRRDLGCVEGLLLHHFHGPKASRRYWDRWRILVEGQYDPDVDLKRDHQGLWQLTDRSPQLRDQIRAYFRGRNEDSLDVE